MLSVKSSTRLSVSFAKTPDLEGLATTTLTCGGKGGWEVFMLDTSFWTVNERRYRVRSGNSVLEVVKLTFGRLLKGYPAG